ncbi:MAG: YggS family pyridoxal phosphate-dependent enzyme [Chlamydiae bacterium]|nr:YggS family pyridoxal phosphate-dependent enzyme [Chlamydiota bacterium]
MSDVAELHQKIAECCFKSNRKVTDVTLVAVSKYATIDQIKNVHDQGVVHFAENKVIDALHKMECLPKSIHWHFTGRIQSNKINKLVGNFFLIHSVADVKTAKAISDKSIQKGVVQNILLQVQVVKDPSKQGFALDELLTVISEITNLPGVCVKGLMTIAPHTEDKTIIRRCFSGLRSLRSQLQDKGFELSEISMGMSSDFDIAIEEGATYLRIGSLVFKNKSNVKNIL